MGLLPRSVRLVLRRARLSNGALWLVAGVLQIGPRPATVFPLRVSKPQAAVRMVLVLRLLLRRPIRHKMVGPRRLRALEPRLPRRRRLPISFSTCMRLRLPMTVGSLSGVGPEAAVMTLARGRRFRSCILTSVPRASLNRPRMSGIRVQRLLSRERVRFRFGRCRGHRNLWLSHLWCHRLRRFPLVVLMMLS